MTAALKNHGKLDFCMKNPINTPTPKRKNGNTTHRYDDDAFFLACKDFGGRFDDSFPACTLNFFFFFGSGDQLTHTSSTF